MKLKITKTENPPTDDKPKVGNKVKVKLSRKVKNNYGVYNGIVNDEGKAVDNPTELEAMNTMIKYAKNNNSDQLEPNAKSKQMPSNVYRNKFMHIGLLYNKNTKKKNENQA